MHSFCEKQSKALENEGPGVGLGLLRGVGMCLLRQPNAGVPTAGIVSFQLRAESHSLIPRDCDLPREQNGLVDKLCYLTAQTFASDVVGAEMLPSVNPAQSRLLRRR